MQNKTKNEKYILIVRALNSLVPVLTPPPSSVARNPFLCIIVYWIIDFWFMYNTYT